MQEKLQSLRKRLLADLHERRMYTVLGLVIGMSVIPLTVYLAQTSQDNRQHAEAPLTAPVSAPTTRISWDAGTIALHAERFVLTLNGNKFFAQSPDLRVSAAPATPDYAALIATWTEQGYPMRLTMTLRASTVKVTKFWFVSDIQIKQGPKKSDVVSFPGFMGAPLNQSLYLPRLDLTTGVHRYVHVQPSSLHFENITLSVTFPETSPKPTVTPTPTPLFKRLPVITKPNPLPARRP